MEFLEKLIWFSLPITKIKFDPPSKEENALVLGPSLNQQIFPELEILSKYLMLLVLLRNL